MALTTISELHQHTLLTSWREVLRKTSFIVISFALLMGLICRWRSVSLLRQLTLLPHVGGNLGRSTDDRRSQTGDSALSGVVLSYVSGLTEERAEAIRLGNEVRVGGLRC